MGFTTGDFPPVDPMTFRQIPFFERVKICAEAWMTKGFGTPKMVHVIYIVKLIVFYSIGGITVALVTTDGLTNQFWNVDEWLFVPIVYQKAIIWTVLVEILGVAGSWGPLAGHFKPMSGGIHYWSKVGSLRQPPWPDKIPFTAGNFRTPVDVALYFASIASLVVALVVDYDDRGLVQPWAAFLPIVLICLLGLRDTVAWLGARGEQYLPALLFFAVLDPVDMIIALKLLIVAVWIGAGVSKFGPHFSKVVSPMVANTPYIPTAFKPKLVKDFPNDLNPSGITHTLAHLGGTTVEIVLPLTLLFSTNRTITLLAVIGMVIFHLFIISTFPLAVPLEWNVLFAYATIFLFRGHPAGDGHFSGQSFALGDFSSVPVMLLIIAALVSMPILGNLKPQYVSFLPSMRQYAGNWASATWAFAPGCMERLDTSGLVKKAKIQDTQLLGDYTAEEIDVLMHMPLGWRGMHGQGVGLFSLLYSHLGERINDYTVREAEFLFNTLAGFNFGDAHMHDERMIAAIQSKCQFAPGEWIIAWVESLPIGGTTQHYKLIDAALGVIETGTWEARDSAGTQGWLPDGPIPLTVTWRADNAGASLSS